jgi:hypothetical protein
MAVEVAAHIPVAPETRAFTCGASSEMRPWIAFFLFFKEVEINREREYYNIVPVVGMGVTAGQ